MATANIKNFELKIGKTGVMIVVAGMAALLSAAFLFGVDVGKNIDSYPEKIALPQRALALVWRPARIRVDQSSPDNKGGQNPSPPAEENINLTFYNTLTGKKGSVQAEPSPEKQPLFLQSQNEEDLKGKFNIETQKPPATADEKNKENVEPKKEAVANSVSGKSKFLVQVASLKEETKAGKIRKKISDLGFKTEIIKIEIKGKGNMFRVIVSGFATKVQAEEAAQIISTRTKTNCIVKNVDNMAKKN